MSGGTRPNLRALWVLVGCLMCQMGAGLFYGTRALAPDVIGDLGWSRTQWSSAMAPMLLVSSLAQAGVGAACVRFGVRPVLLLSLVFLVGAVTALSNLEHLGQLYLAMALLAIANAGIGDVSIGAVVTQWFQRARGLALGFAFLGTNLGGVIFVYAIAQASAAWDWRAATLAVGLGGVAVILPFALFVVREPRAGEGAGAETDGPHPDTEAAEGADPVPPDEREIRLFQAVRMRSFWILFYVLFCYAFAQLGLVDHLILYLTDLGHSRVEAAGTLGLALGSGIVAKLGAGAVALRLAPRTALFCNTLLLAGSLALVPYAHLPGVLAVFGIGFGVTTAARDVLFPLLVSETFGTRYFAQIFGVLTFAFFPGGGLGPLGLARVHDVTGSYSSAFAVCVALVTLAAFALLGLPRAMDTGATRRPLSSSAQ
ncbi:MFS transporter [Myxococcota bacterium]|nr:MFS transporter [Myxococcota bacterium]